MLSVKEFKGVRVWRTKPTRKGEDKLVRLGKVGYAVFSPDGRKVVGFTVRRPDIVGMVKRADLFLGRDSFEAIDQGILATRGDESFDDAARERLKLDWDACIIWDGMDARTEDGRELGYVGDVLFDARTGAVKRFLITDGGMANALVGQVSIAGKDIVGYEKGFLVVSDKADVHELTGGLAGKAGEAYGRAKMAGAKATGKAGKAASEALDKGSRGLGKAIGKARRAVAELIEDDPDEPEALDEALVEDAEPRALASGEKKPAKKKTYRPAGDGAKKPASAAKKKSAAGTKKKGSGKSGVEQAASAIGKQLGKTQGMFAAFKKEFDKNSK